MAAQWPAPFQGIVPATGFLWRFAFCLDAGKLLSFTAAGTRSVAVLQLDVTLFQFSFFCYESSFFFPSALQSLNLFLFSSISDIRNHFGAGFFSVCIGPSSCFPHL